MLIAALAAAVALVGGTYAAISILTADAPPPPRFGGAGGPEFAPAIDGRWYSGGCRPVEIAGGWLLPGAGTALVSGDGKELGLDEPVDLTSLRTDGEPTAFELADDARLSIRWQSGTLRIEGTAGTNRVDVRLVRRRSARC